MVVKVSRQGTIISGCEILDRALRVKIKGNAISFLESTQASGLYLRSTEVLILNDIFALNVKQRFVI